MKGLDILLETFKNLPELELFICAPKEDDFNKVYEKILNDSKNIHFVGFITVAEKKFNNLTKQCGYIILPSCSEGIATSVVSCMRKGIVPITTYESGIDSTDFGFLIKDLEIEKLKSQLKEISEISKEKFLENVIKTYFESFNYTQTKFSEMFEKSIISVINKTGIKPGI